MDKNRLYCRKGEDMPKVFSAKPYRFGAMGGFGDAAYMLIRQYQFPVDEYEEGEELLGADHDRCVMWDPDHAHRCFAEHTGTGSLGFESWARNSDPKKILAFIKAILKADPNIEWTGFRVMGTVNRSNGFSVWTLELFAKSPISRTKVTSEDIPESLEKIVDY